MGKNNKWFEPGKSLGWRKDYSQTKRRETALKSRKGDYLKTARALQSLANVTSDAETRRKAEADAKYFYKRHQIAKKKNDKK